MRHLLAFASLFLPALLPAQSWIEGMQEPERNFFDVQADFNAYWEGRAVERGKGYRVFKRWEWLMEPRTHPTGVRPDPQVYAKALKDLASMRRVQGAKSNADWQPIGPAAWANWGSGYNPGNGRVNCITVDPTNASVIYVGTPAGGLWKSTNGGAQWTSLFDDAPTLGVSGVAVDPTDPQVVYCATGDGDGTDTYSMGVIKSTDGGGTWNSTGLDWHITAVRTTRMLRMHPTDPLTLLCAANNGLWRTEDGGDAWTMVAEGSFHDVEFKPDDPSIVYACGDRFFRSLDGGSTFTPVTAGLPAANLVNRMRIAVSPNDPFKVYVLAGSESDASYLGLYRSTDGGSNFTVRSTSPNLFGYEQDGSDGAGQSGYDMALSVDPANADRVWIGGINVWRSTNGGTSWTPLSDWFFTGAMPYTHADIHSLDVYNGQLWCGSDGGVFRSAVAGGDWTDLSAGLRITQYYRFGSSELVPDRMMAGAQDNGMNLIDGGTWAHVYGADGMEGAVDPFDPDILYGEYQYGGISRSDDGGQNFFNINSELNEESGWVAPFVLDQQQEGVIIAGFQNLWRSEDRGDNWEQWTDVNTTRTVRAIAIAPGNSNVVYYANNNWMLRTLNNGGTWEAASTGLPDNAITSIAVDDNDAQHVFVALSGYTDGNKVFESTDAGNTWQNISGNLPNVPANTIVYMPESNDGIYVGNDIGVFYKDADLGNWQPFSTGLPKVIVTELEVNQAAGKLRCSTFGRGLWETDLYVPVAEPPAASFSWDAEFLCEGSTVRFTDASIGAQPGWEWTFPGGTPPTSTEASPEVVYSMAGTYTATLTVTNASGTDSYTADIPMTILPNQVTVNITLDDYPGESSWSITNDNTGQDVFTSGPFSGLEPGTDQSLVLCLEAGCYTFTMSDSYGDGMCCDNGNGSYEVLNPQLGTIASGGSFTYTESTPFCVDIPTAMLTQAAPARLSVRPAEHPGTYNLDLHNASGPFTVNVIDACGRTVQDPLSWSTLSGLLLDLSGAASGVYMVHVRSGDRYHAARVVR